MIEGIKEFIACQYLVQVLGSGVYQNLNARNYKLAASMMILGIVQVVQQCQRILPRQFHQRMWLDTHRWQQAEKTYVSLLKCAMCHRPKPVSDYSAETWAEDILPKMSKKARLSPQEYADVLAYVTTTTNATLPKSESNK